MIYKTSEARRAANKRYRERHKDQEKINTYRRTTKMFVTKYATLQELTTLNETIQDEIKKHSGLE